MPTYANELDYADSEPANQICGQTTVGKVHAISKSAPAISNCHQNLFVSTNEEGALAPQMFGPLCLVFAGKRAIGRAMCYGKCGPNLLLQPLVEGCQAGQGEASPSHAGAVPACTAALLFHAAGAASSALQQLCNAFWSLGSTLPPEQLADVHMLGGFWVTCTLAEAKWWLDALLVPASPCGVDVAPRQSCFSLPSLLMLRMVEDALVPGGQAQAAQCSATCFFPTGSSSFDVPPPAALC